jgi:chemotaxis protein methyltransferase CheR
VSVEAIRRWVRREIGIVAGADSEPFERRLRRIQERYGWASLDDLAAALEHHDEGPLREDVIGAATTQETWWFRDAALFEALKSLVTAHGGGRVTIWSAGCAFGQEIYSVAILLAEAGVALDQVRLLATDVAPHAIRRAAAGRYLSLEMARGLPAQLREGYFTREGGEWLLRRDIRESVEFRRHDLREPIGETFDIVLCRHVLMYFDRESQRQVLLRLARAIQPGGVLALGNAESIRQLDVPFAKSSIGGVSFYRPVQRKLE